MTYLELEVLHSLNRVKIQSNQLFYRVCVTNSLNLARCCSRGQLWLENNNPLFTTVDAKHSEEEDRYFAFGHTNGNRLLTIVFTIREKKIRIISAREMNKKERAVYHEESAKI